MTLPTQKAGLRQPSPRRAPADRFPAPLRVPGCNVGSSNQGRIKETSGPLYDPPAWIPFPPAQRAGLPRMGSDPSDPRYGAYQFKRAWGATVVAFYNAEILLSPPLSRLHQQIAGRLWHRLPPLLWWLKGTWTIRLHRKYGDCESYPSGNALYHPNCLSQKCGRSRSSDDEGLTAVAGDATRSFS